MKLLQSDFMKPNYERFIDDDTLARRQASQAKVIDRATYMFTPANTFIWTSRVDVNWCVPGFLPG